MAGGFEINEKALGLGVSPNNTGKNDQTISHESRTLGDQEIYDLLIRIDEGYFISETEKQTLSSVTSISWSNIDKLPNSMRLLTSLTSLDLSLARVIDISAVSNLTSLTSLDLSYTGVSDISALSHLTSLTSLDLSSTRVSNLGSLQYLSELMVLDLSGIKSIDLSTLPRLYFLKKLNLQNSKTTSIPESLLDYNLNFIVKEKEYFSYYEKGIYIYGLALTDQPIEIFSQNRELIRAYYREGDQVPVNECKVIFLGDAESGKTHSIRRLVENGEFL